jgi:hypothetical protein
VTVSHSTIGDDVLRVFTTIRDFLQGVWESQKASLAGPLIRAKVHNDDAMMFIVFGNLLGYPFQSTFYSRLLFVPLMEKVIPWQKRMLKEQDVLECMND